MTMIKGILFSILLITSSYTKAKVYDSIDAIINEGSDSHTTIPVPPKPVKKVIKNIKLKKNKAGQFEVPWSVLHEYNLKTKKMGMNLKKIVKKNIIIKGFMLPLDYSAKNISEFLLLPFIPSCAHIPPPPANQIIKAVIKGKKIKPSYWPIEVSGLLTVDTSKTKDPYMTNGVYTLVVDQIKELKK